MRATAAFRAGLGAALVLARGRPEGIDLLAGEPAEQMAVAGYSFWAAAFCLPPFFVLRALEWLDDGVPPEPVHGVALDLLGYGVGWAGFALLMWFIAGALGRRHLWPRFVTVWNWCNVLQYLVAMGWAMWLEWFATREALELPGAHAAGLVFLDVALGAVLAVVTGYSG
jgi:hypothetical protein